MNFTFDQSRKSYAQGDMYLIPIMEIPDGATLIDAEDGQHIITHSETGHHHVVMERPDIRQYSAMDQFRGFLEMEQPADLVHLRDHHQHATQTIAPGAYLIQRQAAFTPQGWALARD